MMGEGTFNLLAVVGLYLMALVVVFMKRRSVTVGVFGVSLYALIAIAACVYCMVFGASNMYPRLPFLPLLYAWSMSLVLLWPLIRFRDGEIRSLEPFDDRFLSLALWVLLGIVLLINLAVLPKTLADVSRAWHGNALEMYNLRRGGNLTKSGLSFGLWNALSVVAKSFGEILVFFFFYSLSDPKKRKLSAGLGICSLFPLLDTLSGAGRNGLVTFGLNLVCLWLLFRKLLDDKVRRVVFVTGWLVLVFIVGGISAVTISRFGQRGSYGAWESVARYAGQPLLNFAYYVPEANAISCGDNTFPAVRMALGMSKILSRDIYRGIWECSIGIPMGIFYTVVGDFVLDYGWFWPPIMFALFSWWATTRSRMRGGRVSLHTLFLLYAVFLVAGHGMFYFMYKTFSGNLKILAMILTYIGLRFIVSKHQNTTSTPMGT